jgi:hypothetical protein
MFWYINEINSAFFLSPELGFLGGISRWKNDGEESGKACEYIINRSNDFWMTTSISSNAFNVFDENQDFDEFLFIC